MTTRPTNAYELCERVCEHIAAEPLTYNQATFLSCDVDEQRAVMGRPTDCGTMACRAGWMVVLTDGINRAVAHEFHIEERACELLGVISSTSDIGWDVADLFNGGAIDEDILKPGTEAYALEGVRGLRAFMATHEAHLRATPIPEAQP